ncbi:TlpA family protein disulfide reductase [Pedobacter rhodius]|uniref:TlpA disulfide reductase family protein n=1 Tax=Pedobacter rhodius TaxID=3004098 RepID=A0ABT4KY75_9SPHI|nr:TlpA disulfide reductase family protein [Pedobacter sp. SJ11]MCZ4223864.1 TlpA disulfide reductase family protein [Pedobacter sp. SJ11]
MKIHIFTFFLFSSTLARAQTAPVKWATQETFFEDLVGQDLPDFKGETLAGKPFSKQNLKNQIVLVNFWFEECPPCIKEIPELNKFVDRYKNEQIRFIAITYDEPKKAEKFSKKIGYKYEVIFLSRDEIRKLNINHGYPSNILVGHDGKIIKAISSVSFSDELPAVKAQTIDFEAKLKAEILKVSK